MPQDSEVRPESDLTAEERQPPFWQPYLPSVKEEGTYTGPFSTYVEYHACILGLAVGGASSAFNAPEIALGVVMLIMGIHTGFQMTNVKALNEMKREPWYSVAGIAFGYLGNDATLQFLAWLDGLTGVSAEPVPLPDPVAVVLALPV